MICKELTDKEEMNHAKDSNHDQLKKELTHENLIKNKEAILEAFECQKTGNCCRADGYVYANAKEIEQMAQFLDIDTQHFMEKYVKKKNGWMLLSDLKHRPTCFLTKDNLCGIHTCRPSQCRTYPDWPTIWENKEHFFVELVLCKGLQKAIRSVFQ